MFEKYRLYINLCSNQKKKISIGIILLIVEGMVAVKLPFVMEKLMESIFNLHLISYRAFLMTFGTYLVFTLSQVALSYFTTVLFKTVGVLNTKCIGDLMMDKLFFSIKRSDSDLSTGDKIRIINSDVFDLSERGILIATQIIKVVINICALGYYMARVSIVLTGIVIAIFISLMFIQRKMNLIIGNHIEKIRELSGNYSFLANGLAQNYTEYRRAKSYNYFSSKYKSALNNLLMSMLKLEKTFSQNELIMGMSTCLVIALVFLVGSRLIIGGAITLSSLMTFNIYSGVFGSYLVQLPDLFAAIKGFDTSYFRVLKVIDLECYSEDQNLSYKDIQEIRSIQARGVDFKYEKSGEKVIDDFNACFNKGRTYCICGENGSGKSTLLSILMGEYPTQDGQLLLNDRPVNLFETKLKLDEYVSIFSSNAVMFHDTILANITFNREVNRDEMNKITELAKMFGIHDWIMSLEHQYNTMINDQNDNLSDGQRQKIALIRSLIQNSDVLMLDEMEKHLDYQSKINVVEYLSNLKNEKLVIFISHDDYIQSMSDSLIQIG